MTYAVRRLNHVASTKTSNVDKKSSDGETVVRLCNYTDVYKNASITTDMDFMVATATKDQVSKFGLKAGDTVFTKDSETADDIGIPAYVAESASDLVCGYHLAIARAYDGETDPRFLYWCLASPEAAQQWSVLASGVTRVGLRQADIGKLEVPSPPFDIQRKIAAFLDRETAQIDDLIGKQDQLIELLAEKRQAIIAHAVTKGLDPAAPTRPSGIPWLGDVNASWPLRPLKAAGYINLGKMIQPGPKLKTDFEAPYLRAANVQPNGALVLDDVKNMWFNDSELQSLDVRSGDLVVVEGGIGGFGRAAYVDRDLPGFGYQNSINRIRPSKWADGRFLTYLLLTARHAGYMHAYCTGVSMPHLTAEKLAAISVPLPDRATQTKISDHIDARLAKLNALSDNASAVISVLHERRSALISAAVTGKLEVHR